MTRSVRELAERNAGAHGESADQVASVLLRDGAVLVVADGAGNSSAGRLAAANLVEFLRAAVGATGFPITKPGAWAQSLADFDQMLVAQGRGGETTGVVVCVSRDVVVGASVGDSEAWVLEDGRVHVLTERQIRKPLLGSGEARPVSFEHHFSGGTLLVASDGLFKYAAADAVIRVMGDENAERMATTLSELPLMANGLLPDDLGLIVCRV